MAAAASGGVLGLYSDGRAMVETMEPPLDGAARIVFAARTKLRLGDARSHSSRG